MLLFVRTDQKVQMGGISFCIQFPEVVYMHSNLDQECLQLAQNLPDCGKMGNDYLSSLTTDKHHNRADVLVWIFLLMRLL